MISLNQIAQLVDQSEHRPLIDRILANGRCRSPLVRRMLEHPAAAMPAALGLALQRICEMTYRPEPLADSIARRLLVSQRADGLFGSTVDRTESSARSTDTTAISLAATAVALRGLITHQSQRAMVGLAAIGSVNAAIDRAINTLAFHLNHHRDSSNDAPARAIILWQLGDIEQFRNHVSIDDVLARLDESSADLLHDDLCRFAHAMAA